MIVSHKHRFIFIKTRKTRKTAGTSLEVFLSALCGNEDIVTPIVPHVEPHRARNHEGFFNHMPGHAIRSAIGEECWNSYFRFCVERNPWEKTLSHYHFINQQSMTGELSFEDYLGSANFRVDHPLYTEPDNPDYLLVDRILCYERLDQELAEVFAHLNIAFPGTLGIKAKSEYRTDRRPYQDVLSEKQAALIGAAFQQETSLFGYRY